MEEKRQEPFTLNGANYRLQDHYCNKERCKCKRGEPHGPYWKAYFEGGNTYVGKNLPPEIIAQLDSIKELTPEADGTLRMIEEAIQEERSLLSLLQDHHRSIRAAKSGEYVNEQEKEYLSSIGLGAMVER